MLKENYIVLIMLVPKQNLVSIEEDYNGNVGIRNKIYKYKWRV